MAMCIRDMMQGNPKLAAMGRVEESLGYNAIASGFRGQRHWTDQYPNGDTAEALLNSSFDWNGIRQPLVVATENDSLNGVAMLFGHLMTGTAQILLMYAPTGRRSRLSVFPARSSLDGLSTALFI